MKIKATLFVLVVLLIAVITVSYYVTKEAFEDIAKPVPGVKYNIYANILDPKQSLTKTVRRYLTTLPNNVVGTWSGVPTAPPQNWYLDEKGRLVSDDTDKYATTPYCIQLNGRSLSLAPCNDNSTTFQYVGNQLQIVTTALCLNVAGGSIADGAIVDAFPCAQARADTVTWFFEVSPNEKAAADARAAADAQAAKDAADAKAAADAAAAAAAIPAPMPAPAPAPAPAPPTPVPIPATLPVIPNIMPIPAPVPKPAPAPVIPNSIPAPVSPVSPVSPVPTPIPASAPSVVPQNIPIVPESTISPTGQDASSLQKQMDLFGAIQKVVRNELLAWRNTKPILPGETEHEPTKGGDAKPTNGDDTKPSKETPATAQGKEYENSCYKGTEYRCPKNPDGSCPPIPDMSSYIKKDQIPCWGCSLDY